MRLPAFVKKISPIGETLEAMEAGTALLAEEAAERNRQLSVATADSGLSLWEADYSLPASGDTEMRYARILAAMAARRTLTVEELKAMAVIVGGADGAEVEEDFSNWRAMLTALYKNRVPEDVTVLRETVRRQKPAHLTVEVEPLTTVNGGIRRYTALTGRMFVTICAGPCSRDNQEEE